MNYVLTENAVGKIRRAITPSAGNTGAVGANGRPIDPDMFPAPWTVRWSASEANGAGAWVIWLPDRSKLALFGGAFISTITGVTAATKLPGGWYTIDDAQAASTTAYLVITVTEATGAATAEISVSAGQATTGTAVYNLLVATMATEAATGAKRVKQFVDSAVTLGTGGGGAAVTPDDISTEFIPDPPSGTQPDGDEGELQIKGFKAGTPADTNTLADYLQSQANLPSGGISLVARGVDSGGRQLFYLPLAALFSSSGIAGNVSLGFVGDLRWDTSSHTLQKRVDTVNLKTGAVTQGNWETITNGNTTPISNII